MSAKSNKTVLSFAVEDSLGTLPGTPDWTAIEWNDLSSFGSTLTTVSRSPVNQDLMEYEGAVSDLDSAVAFQTDLTYSSFNNFAEGMFYSSWQAQTGVIPTAVSSTEYTHAAIAVAIPAGRLVYARNFSVSANDGLKVVAAASTTTATKVTSLSVEASPPAGARFDVVGVQGATGDLEIDANGNLASTALDFETLGLTVGQMIFIGGDTAATRFATAEFTGYARVRVIAENLLTLDKKDWSVDTDTGSGKTIQVFYGSFIRNVAQNHADFLDQSYTFEGLMSGATEGVIYEYPEGNKLNSASLDFPLTDKAGISFDFIGTDTPVPTGSQASGDRLATYETAAYGTTGDFARLSLKNSSLADYSTTFKNLTIEINRSVSPEKSISTLGAVDLNTGMLSVTGSSSVIYDNSDLVDAARNNETTSLDFAILNTDGGLFFDIPSMKFEAVNKNFPVNESVLLDVNMKTFKDAFFGYVFSCTKFPYLPTAAA